MSDQSGPVFLQFGENFLANIAGIISVERNHYLRDYDGEKASSGDVKVNVGGVTLVRTQTTLLRYFGRELPWELPVPFENFVEFLGKMMHARPGVYRCTIAEDGSIVDQKTHPASRYDKLDL